MKVDGLRPQTTRQDPKCKLKIGESPALYWKYAVAGMISCSRLAVASTTNKRQTKNGESPVL